MTSLQCLCAIKRSAGGRGRSDHRVGNGSACVVGVTTEESDSGSSATLPSRPWATIFGSHRCPSHKPSSFVTKGQDSPDQQRCYQSSREPRRPNFVSGNRRGQSFNLASFYTGRKSSQRARRKQPEDTCHDGPDLQISVDMKQGRNARVSGSVLSEEELKENMVILLVET